MTPESLRAFLASNQHARAFTMGDVHLGAPVTAIRTAGLAQVPDSVWAHLDPTGSVDARGLNVATRDGVVTGIILELSYFGEMRLMRDEVELAGADAYPALLAPLLQRDLRSAQRALRAVFNADGTLARVIFRENPGTPHIGDEEAVFGDGYTASLERVEMARTNSGILEGYPRRGSNDAKLASLKQAYPGAAVVGDVQTPIDGARMPSALGEAATLPRVTCIGHWRCHTAVPGTDGDESTLTVIWFQETMARTLPDTTRALLHTIHWADFAQNHEY